MTTKIDAIVRGLSKAQREAVAEAEKLTSAIMLIASFQWRDGDEKSAAVAMRHIARTATGAAIRARLLEQETDNG